MESAKRKGAKATKEAPAKKPRASKKDGVKRPTSAYIYFVSDYRLILKKKNIDTSKVQEVAKLCGAAWQGMSESERRPYQEKYLQDKRRYDAERTDVDKANGKDPSKPKRPQTAYFFFLADFRKEMTGKALPEDQKIPSLAGQKWKIMSEGEKQKYHGMVEKDKVRYTREMSVWKESHPDEPKKAPARRKPARAPTSESDEDEDEEDDEEDEDEDEEE